MATANVALREIGWDNLHAVLALDVEPAQQQFVASNAVSLAEAHFNPGAWFRAVYADDVLVGFVMLFDPTVPGAIASDPVEPTDMVLWRLMIDRRYQRQRLGRRTLDAVRTHIVGLGRFRRLLTSYVPGPGGPKDFYLAHGFTETGRLWDEGAEVEIALDL
ncbi:MAG: GNAT family N-acetyltransferase [Rhodospirillaceae bacterium]|nr:GNAT family N-acetyltransferase [Rhodospirillaceae bacterium]